MEASSGSSRPISREDRRLALTERFWDLLAMVLLEKVWEMCMFKSLSSSPTWRANLLTPNHSSDGFSHGICKTVTGQKPGPGFFPGRRHSDAQVSGAFVERVGQQIKNGAMARRRVPQTEVFVTLL